MTSGSQFCLGVTITWLSYKIRMPRQFPRTMKTSGGGTQVPKLLKIPQVIPMCTQGCKPLRRWPGTFQHSTVPAVGYTSESPEEHVWPITAKAHSSPSLSEPQSIEALLLTLSTWFRYSAMIGNHCQDSHLIYRKINFRILETASA